MEKEKGLMRQNALWTLDEIKRRVRSLKGLEKERVIRDKIEADLEGFRTSWLWVRDNMVGEKRKSNLNLIEKKAKECSNKLKGTVEMKIIHDLMREDRAMTRQRLLVLISWTVEQFNIDNTLSPEQAKMLVDEIIAEFGYLRMEDVFLCFRAGVMGKYGKIYNRFDVGVVMGWLSQYSLELSHIRAQEMWNNHLANKESRHEPRGNQEENRKLRMAEIQYFIDCEVEKKKQKQKDK